MLQMNWGLKPVSVIENLRIVLTLTPVLNTVVMVINLARKVVRNADVSNAHHCYVKNIVLKVYRETGMAVKFANVKVNFN